MSIESILSSLTSKATKPTVQFDPLYERPRGGLAYLDDEELLLLENSFLKLTILARELGIPPGESQWYDLSLKLAGLIYRQQRRRGPKKKWNDENDKLLVQAIDSRRNGKPKKSVLQICRHLIKEKEWAGILNLDSKDPAETLKRRYYSASKKVVK